MRRLATTVDVPANSLVLVEGEAFRMQLSFDGPELAQLALTANSNTGRLTFEPLVRDPKSQVQRGPGSNAFALLVLNYLLDRSALRRIWERERTEDANYVGTLFSLRDHEDWFGKNSPDWPGSVAAQIGGSLREIFGRRSLGSPGKRRARIFIYITTDLLPRSNIEVKQDGRLIGKTRIRQLRELVSNAVTNGKAAEPSVANANSRTVDRVARERIRSGTERWVLGSVALNSQPVVGSWTKADIHALLTHFWEYPKNVHASWSYNDLLFLGSSSVNDAPRFDVCGTVNSLDFAMSANPAAGPAIRRLGNRALAWLFEHADLDHNGFVVARVAIGVNGKSVRDLDLRQTAALGYLLSVNGSRLKLAAACAQRMVAKDHSGSNLLERADDALAIAHSVFFLRQFARTRPEPNHPKYPSGYKDPLAQAAHSAASRSLHELMGEDMPQWTSGLIADGFVDQLWTTTMIADLVLRRTRNWIDGMTNKPVGSLGGHPINHRLSDAFLFIVQALNSPRFRRLEPNLRFALECRAIAVLKILDADDTVGPGAGHFLREEFDFADWERRSRDVCSPQTLKFEDVTTTTYLLRSLLEPGQLRQFGDGD